MELRIQKHCHNINWDEVPAILKEVDMANFSPEIHQKAFTNSEAVVFVFDQDRLIGFGRAISDGAYEAALYDIAVRPEYQGKKIGTMIVKHLTEALPTCNVILFAAPGKEPFYEKCNFRKLKTGMGLFQNPQRMHQRGFIE